VDLLVAGKQAVKKCLHRRWYSIGKMPKR